MITLYLIVGLPGAGKTVHAKELAREKHALRFTPDEWMLPLFGEPEANGIRDVVEGRLITVAMDALQLGTSVVLDFGFWSRDERCALRWLAAAAGARCEIVYLAVDRVTQLERIRARAATTPHETFPITEAELDEWRAEFEVPDDAELRGGPVADRPALGWPAWAAQRWPSLTV